jgi:hypothetical protein
LVQPSRLSNALCWATEAAGEPLISCSGVPQTLLPSGLFKEKRAKDYLPPEPAAAVARLICCMKRILLISAVLLGAVTASQAGVRFGIGIGLPLPGVVISGPAPCVVAPPVFYASPPAVCVAPPYFVAPAPVYYGCRPGWYGYRGWVPRRDWHRRW